MVKCDATTNGTLAQDHELKSIHILQIQSLFSKWEKIQSHSSMFWSLGRLSCIEGFKNVLFVLKYQVRLNLGF